MKRIHQANALVESGNRLGAIALLAECRDLPCWSEVYVHWAQYSDMEFAQRVERIQSSTDTIEEKLLLWDRLGEEFLSSYLSGTNRKAEAAHPE